LIQTCLKFQKSLVYIFKSINYIQMFVLVNMFVHMALLYLCLYSIYKWIVNWTPILNKQVQSLSPAYTAEMR